MQNLKELEPQQYKLKVHHEKQEKKKERLNSN